MGRCGRGRRAGVEKGGVGVRDFGISDGDLCAVCYARDDAWEHADSLYDGRVSDGGGVRVLLLLQHDLDEEADSGEPGRGGGLLPRAGWISRAGVAGWGNLGTGHGV